MSDRNRAVVVRIALVLLVVVAGFVIFQEPMRRAEAGAAVWLLHSLGEANVTQQGAIISVFPSGHAAFRALVAPSCSAFASILTIACLGLLASTSTRRRRTLALVVACSTVAAGNIIRIAASVGIGFVSGRSSLILFHDVAGSIFGLAYTLVGYLISLHILLPKHRPAPGFVGDRIAPPSIEPARPWFVAG